jgi:hypothetical protein
MPRKIQPVSPAVVTLRIVVVDPPAGVRWALQIGRDELERPSSAGRAHVCFTTVVRVASSSRSNPLRLLGPAVQGPPDTRFLYLNSGIRAGQAKSCWDRRAKVPLRGITWSIIRAAAAKPHGALEARVSGTASDGGPACASVSLLGAGWSVA